MTKALSALRASSVLLAALFTQFCSAADLTHQEAQDLYSHFKSEIILEDAMSDPYYSEMQALDDEEHGWNDPVRLIFFDEILKAKGRTEETDREILVPWLVRYLWVTEYPNYTQGAWRLLRSLRLERTFMEIAARDVLTNHPHGLARAAVIEGTEDYQPWLEDPELTTLLERLAFDDPHPDVRLNALDHVRSASVATIKAALEADLSAQVRVGLAKMLIYRERDSKKTETALRDALFSPKNTSVAPQMMRTYLRSGPVKGDFQRLSQGLNWLALHGDHPLASTIKDQFGWQLDKKALPIFLADAPFADGAALKDWVRAVFADENRPLKDRGHALNALAGVRTERLDFQEIADFLFEPDHDTESLNPLFDYGGSRVVRRLLKDRPDIPVSQAATRPDLAMEYLKFLSEPGADGEMRGGSLIHNGVLDEAASLVGSAGTATDALIESLLNHAQTLPDGGIYGVSSLLKNTELVPNARFESFAKGLHEEVWISPIMDAFIDRLRPGPFEKPELAEGDLTLALALLNIAEARNPGEPEKAYRAAYEVIYGLPVKAKMPTGLSDLDPFEAKLREMNALNEDGAGYWAIKNWLGETE